MSIIIERYHSEVKLEGFHHRALRTYMYLRRPKCRDYGRREVYVGPGYEEIAEGRCDKDGIYQSIDRLHEGRVVLF